jgi:hypothetical protein
MEEEPEVETNPGLNLEMPEDCMYGELGILSRECKTPLGLTYPTMLTCHSSKITTHTMCKTRINVYCGNILRYFVQSAVS